MNASKLLRIIWALKPIIAAISVLVALVWSLIWALNQKPQMLENNYSALISTPSPEQLIESDRNDVKWKAREIIEASLKAPSTAKWPNYNNFAAAQQNGQPDIWDVMGYVDSQNSYGATIRTNWQVTLKKVNGSWILLKIDSH
jgi:hypothetical protein